MAYLECTHTVQPPGNTSKCATSHWSSSEWFLGGWSMTCTGDGNDIGQSGEELAQDLSLSVPALNSL